MYYLNMVLEASIIVQFIMLVLLFLSTYSLALSLWKFKLFSSKQKQLKDLEHLLSPNLNYETYYGKLVKNPNKKTDLELIFLSGFFHFSKIWQFVREKHQENNITKNDIELLYENVSFMQENMYLKIEEIEKEMNQQLSHLGTIGSVSPYIGLLGTVIGIIEVMHAFTVIGDGQQLTIDMIAPGISEALIATAMGLFAAIPAYIMNNKFAEFSKSILSEYYHFTDKFILKIKSNTLNKIKVQK